MEKRAVDVVVISDVHLGTYGCRAKELVAYLKSILPNILILNGDIIDGWQFSKRLLPFIAYGGNKRSAEPDNEGYARILYYRQS